MHYRIKQDGSQFVVLDADGARCLATASHKFAADLAHILSAGSGQRLMQQLIDLPTVVACVVDSPEDLGS